MVTLIVTLMSDLSTLIETHIHMFVMIRMMKIIKFMIFTATNIDIEIDVDILGIDDIVIGVPNGVPDGVIGGIRS